MAFPGYPPQLPQTFQSSASAPPLPNLSESHLGMPQTNAFGIPSQPLPAASLFANVPYPGGSTVNPAQPGYPQQGCAPTQMGFAAPSSVPVTSPPYPVGGQSAPAPYPTSYPPGPPLYPINASGPAPYPSSFGGHTAPPACPYPPSFNGPHQLFDGTGTSAPFPGGAPFAPQNNGGFFPRH